VAPKEWNIIKLGMTRDEVDKLICGIDYKKMSDEEVRGFGFPASYDMPQKYFNKWRNRYIWVIHVEFDGAGSPPKGGWVDIPFDRLKDKVVKVKIYKQQEAWLNLLPYPMIYKTYHS
jgi:hypothetical protein